MTKRELPRPQFSSSGGMFGLPGVTYTNDDNAELRRLAAIGLRAVNTNDCSACWHRPVVLILTVALCVLFWIGVVRWLF